MPAEKLKSLLVPPIVFPAGMYSKSDTGQIVAGKHQNEFVSFGVPIVLAVLMYLIVLVGASPMAMNVIEEKQLRIAEVLLGSLRPFELMMGKLLGGVGVAVTLGVIYVGGEVWVAKQQGVLQFIQVSVLIWFLAFLVLAVLMYGSLFVAVGQAASNVKEAQSLIMPVMVVIVLPMMILTNLLQYPNGPIGMGFSFFPLSAPIVTITRVAIPPGIPTWQPIASIVVSLIATVALVWAAGRIFRVGILMQGQGAELRRNAPLGRAGMIRSPLPPGEGLGEGASKHRIPFAVPISPHPDPLPEGAGEETRAFSTIISTAASALRSAVSNRSCACFSSLVVSTPKITGTPDRIATS